jgi:hypothetical protein
MNHLGDELTEDHKLEAQRAILRATLPSTVVEIEIALRDAGLHYAVYIGIPNSGAAIATLTSPLDPNDAEWERINEIVRGVIGGRVGVLKLLSQEVACGAATGIIAAADLEQNTEEVT